MPALASYIDHTILKQDTTLTDIHRICDEARQAGFAAVCVPPIFVHESAQKLTGCSVKVATVIGFPFGYHLPAIKAAEAEMAIIGGADELDMVAQIGAIKSGNWKALELEVREVLEVVKMSGKKLKVIVESGILTDEELIHCCELYSRFNIDFLKTSTGYAAAGASIHAVQLMRQHLPERIGIKASGGIKTLKFAQELLAAGATRIGCSASLQILAEEA
ncbi:MAG: deoxyribose-phosphate aldolase [Bacteroidetes bacterium]|nr:deoxyribose-phosphate aldolase [Bacteroidota bacterium]